jgi:hypothetical protein
VREKEGRKGKKNSWGGKINGQHLKNSIKVRK